MSLIKLGSHLRILKTANAAEGVLLEKPVVEASKPVISKVLEQKNSDFLYYRARAISAGDQGPLTKEGTRPWNFNGNKDYFPRKELESSYQTFVGRNIFLDHNSESSLYSIGKIIDALPIDDAETGEFYIELVGKIDRKLHPEICRKIETGELNSTSMGCSVDESICSICGNVLHSDADDKCDHMGMNLGKEFPAEIDLPEYNIKKGDLIPCFSINKGIVFNEDSIVGVPADPTAVIKTVLSNMKSHMQKTASLPKDEQINLAAELEKVFSQLDDETKTQLKADLSEIFPTVERSNKNLCKCAHLENDHSPLLRCLNANCNCTLFNKESSMTDKNVTPNDETKKVLNKISAYEMEQLEHYVMGKTKKANDLSAQDIIADSAAKEESFLSKIVAKVKDALTKEAGHKCKKCPREVEAPSNGEYCKRCEKEVIKNIRATFTEDKNNVLDSTWSVNDGDKTVLEASLKEIWGADFEVMSFSDQLWATSPEYAKEIVARYEQDGVTKLAADWDVSHKLSKTAADPKLGPSGTKAKPSTGTSNKTHSYPTNPKFEKPKPGTSSKGPAAPAHQDMKVDYTITKPEGTYKAAPAAPKAKEVKTDYAEPKVDAEGKEVKTTPKNPEEKKHDKSEKEVKTDYVAKGTEAIEAEDKEDKKDDKSDKKSSLISWASLTPAAQSSIKVVAKLYIAGGMKNAEAVAKAHSEFITAQETDMKKQASDGTPDESVKGSTLPEGKKEMGDKPEESVEGSTLPGGASPSSAPETSAQGDTEHKTPNLTKKPDEAVKGTTTPADHIPNTQKSEESSKGTTFPDSKKEIGDKADSAVKEASKSESSAPIEAVQDKPALSKATAGDTPESAREGGDLKKDPKDIESVNKKAATEMPMPEDKGGLEDMKVEEKPADPMAAPLDGPAVDMPKAEVSAFDTTEKVDVGEGYSARKDKESKEVIIEKDGQEVKRLPDGFGADMAVVLPLLKAVLGLPPEATAPAAMPGEAAPVEQKTEEPKMDEHPGAEEAHEDELGIKESALKVREAALAEKESAINAKEASIKEEERVKKFASVLQARQERCKKIVAAMVEKDAISMNKEVYDSELKIGTYLLDAQKKAFEYAITAKQKELMAMDDNALLAAEKVIADIKVSASSVNTRKASRIFVSPSFGEELSEDQMLKKIFDTFGTKNRPQ